MRGAVWNCEEGKLEGAWGPVLCGVRPCSCVRELWGLGGVCAKQPPCGEKPGWGDQAVLQSVGKVSLGVNLGLWEHWVTQRRGDRCCGDIAGVAIVSGRCRAGVGIAAWGRGSASASL